MNVIHVARRTGLLLAAVLAVLAPTAAHADGELTLSSDGVHWQDSLDTPLFEGGVQWIPGDLQTASFHVRNDSTDAGDLDVAIARTETDTLIGSGFLIVSVRAGDGAWTSVGEAGPGSPGDGTEIAPGADVRVDVRVALSDDAPNDTRLLATDLDLRVRLTDASATRPDGGHDGDNDGGLGVLPDTGADIAVWLPPLALLMLGTGTFLVLCRRTSRDERPALSQS